MKAKSVLLLGGTGLLSSAVLREARLRDYSVSVMNRGSNNKLLPSDVEVTICNFYDELQLHEKFSNKVYDVVVDFLSRTPADIKRVYPIFKDICQQYIFISTACVYRRAKSDFPITESSAKPNHNWSYSIEKFESEKVLIKMSMKSTSYFTIIRPYITYNKERIPLGISLIYSQHCTIIERIKAGKPWFVWDDGKAMSTLTYVEDFAVGVVGLFLNEKAKNEDFHITSDFVYSQKEIVEMLFNKLKKPISVVSIPTLSISDFMPEYREILIGDRSLDAIFDNSKIKEAVPYLNFNTSLSKGFDYNIDYWKNKSIKIYDYKFDALIDKLLASHKVKCSYVPYSNSDKISRIIYYFYRYLPFRIAHKLEHFIN
jgi:nucleoside-diphosphate-sugar epimerase